MMQQRGLRTKSFIVAVLVVLGFFGTSTPTANADLTSIIGGAIGPALGAAISCNKGAIQSGLGSLFGSGNNASGDAPSGGDASGRNQAADAGNGSTNDGSLDGSSGNTDSTDVNSNAGTDYNTSSTEADAQSQASDGSTEGTGDSSTGASGGGSVPVSNSSIEGNTSKTAEQTAATNKKLTCTNAIARAAAQTILRELTVSTVNWINSGFQGGGPLYIGDTSTFLKDIGDQAVQQFSSVIGFDLKNYPFGREVIQGLIGEVKGTFESSARYSLNNVIAQQYPGRTSADFMLDFRIGGWNGFLSQTDWNNNPIGFSMKAEQELIKRQAGTKYTPAQDIKDQLQRNGGFLDQKKCVDPEDYDPNAKPDGGVDGTAGDDAPKNVCKQWMNQTPGSVVQSTLNKALGTTFDQLGLGEDLSTDLTAIFDALINHFIQKGLNELSKETKSSDSTYGGEKTYGNDGKTNQSYVQNNVSIDGGGANGTNFLNAGDRFQTNIFDLNPTGKETISTSNNDQGEPVYRTNIVGIINRELQLISVGDDQAAVLQKKLGWDEDQKNIWIDLMSKRDPNYTNLLGKQVNLAKRLIPAIYQLDYCIPGPHPGWQKDAQAFLDTEMTRWPKSSKNPWAAAAKITKVFDVGGMLTKILSGIGEADTDHREEKFYAGVMSGALSYHYDNVGVADAGGETILGVGTKNTISDIYKLPALQYNGIVGVQGNEKVNGFDPRIPRIMNTLLSRYITAMNARYSSAALQKEGITATVLSDNATEFVKIPTYTKNIAANEVSIAKSKNIIGQLIALSKRINNLQTNNPPLAGYNPDLKTKEDYDAELEKIAITKNSEITDFQRELRRINDTFNLIAPDLHSEQDIKDQEAVLDNIMNRLEIIGGKGGDLEECMLNVAKPVPDDDTRPSYIPKLMTRLPYPLKLLPYTPKAFLQKFPVDLSFLPDFYYRRGENPDQIAFMKTLLGDKWDDKKEIRTADVITINDQPIPDALAGFEQFLGMY